MNGKPLLNRRNLTRIVAVLVATFVCVPQVDAQSPLPESPPEANAAPTHPPADTIPSVGTSPSDLPEFEPTADPAAAKRIVDALQGGSSAQIPGGVLGDVIEIIQKRGSILDGSSLDPRMTVPGEMSPPDVRTPSRTGGSPVHTAESLLRAARQLESLNEHASGPQPTHPDLLSIPELARQMRIQATRLLSIEFPQAIQ